MCYKSISARLVLHEYNSVFNSVNAFNEMIEVRQAGMSWQ